MAAGYSVGIASETKAFKQGVDAGIIKPLENAEDALTDLGKSKGPDQLERGMKDAQKATEKLQKETKETADTIEQEFRDSYRKLKESSEGATRDVGEGFDEMKGEANATARETAASFDGSFESIVGMAQETAANAFAGFGPAGAVAGLAAAAGIGLVSAAFDQSGVDAEAMAERTEAAFDRMVEAGGKFLDAETERALIQDALNDPTDWQTIQDIVEATGAKTADVARAVALEGSERDKVLGLLKEAKSEYEKQTELQALSNSIGEQSALGVDALIGKIELKSKAEEEATRKYETYSEAVDTGEENARTQIERTQSADQRRWEAQTEAHRRHVDKVNGAPPYKLVPELDTSGIDRAMDAIKNKKHHLRVEAEVFTRAGTRVI
ncbi:hypothetical protein [Diaminobutyricimonas sp. LJ205]|uniref:hypothetical protein n=1 Tax=Diaminobutyricimonas sp. LJ205 TaxID=2683590 RepID=UPI0012F51BBC|nr:hypothetical protein [Diaminobutyricimonas sp. LJ205]